MIPRLNPVLVNPVLVTLCSAHTPARILKEQTDFLLPHILLAGKNVRITVCYGEMFQHIGL